MTGPGHYQAAEQLLDWAQNRDTVTERQREHWTGLAQVHATLALADAVIASAINGPDSSRDDWYRTTGRVA